MPTVPTEQNRTGIADVTDAKLQPGDYSGTGLQALGAGMQQLGGVGAKIAGDVQQRQDSDDAFEIKKAWNAYAEGARSIRADAIGKFDADPQGMLQRMTQDYGGLLDWIRSGLKNDRQRGQFDQVIAERFDYDLSGALTESERALQRGHDQQSLLLEQNAADDAVDNADDPALFDKHLHTGAESIAGRAAARGDDPAAIEQSVTAYRSGIQRRALQNVIDRDPVAAANRYRTIRDGMTAADQQTARKELFEPLARALGARDVDGLLPPVEMEGPAPLSPEQRASVAEAIEAQPWTDARKRYAREDLATRGSLEDRQRKQAADAAKDKGLAIAEQLGPDFTSITQLPPEIRRDLDDDTMQTLGLQAQDNLDGRQVAPNGEASLMMNLIASQNPAAFAKEDLRLVRGKVTPEEYNKLARLQAGLGQENIGGGSERRTAAILIARASGQNANTPSILKASIDMGGRTGTILHPGIDRDIVDQPSSAPDAFVSSSQFDGRDREQLPAGAKSADIYLNLLNPVEDVEAIKALKKMGSPPGWTLVYSHGSKSGVISDKSRGIDGQGMDAHTIFVDLQRKGYKKGTPIILSSCFAANQQEALKLSKMTEGVVYAARAFVTVPSDVHAVYDLTAYSKGYGVGEKVGYARFENGHEVPSDLLGLSYDPESNQWSWRRLETPMNTGIRIPYTDKSLLTQLREGWHL